MEFIGKACATCHNLFEIDDVPVVCPYCGKTFHRDCYMQAGGKICPVCDNKGLEESDNVADIDFDFDENGNLVSSKYVDENGEPFTMQDFDENDEYVLPRLYDKDGNPVSLRFFYKDGNHVSSQLFDKDGNPIPMQFFDENGEPIEVKHFNQNGEHVEHSDENGESARENQEESHRMGSFSSLLEMLKEIGDMRTNKEKHDLSEEVTNGEFEEFIQTGVDEYFMNFRKFFKEKKSFSFNFVAFIWPDVYFAYRKMYFWWAVSMVFVALNAIPSVLSMAEIELVSKSAITAVNLLVGFTFFFKAAMMAFANLLFYKHCEKKIKFIKSDECKDVKKGYKVLGGVSLLNVVISCALQLVVLVLLMYLL